MQIVVACLLAFGICDFWGRFSWYFKSAWGLGEYLLCYWGLGVLFYVPIHLPQRWKRKHSSVEYLGIIILKKKRTWIHAGWIPI